MSRTRPYVLSIAGFDPSGGAGLLADVKTFEANKTMGLSVCTALTIQNDESFEAVDWIGESRVIDQMDILLKRFDLKVVKIGLISGIQMLKVIIERLKNDNPTISIVWDPVLSASAGFDFHDVEDYQSWLDLLEDIYLLTPNWLEIQALTRSDDAFEASQYLSKKTNIFLKGGHNIQQPGKDFLFTTEGKIFPFNPQRIASSAKHGSGCVLSSAIAANLARGYKLHGACLRAKSYVGRFLMSNNSLLGYHKL